MATLDLFTLIGRIAINNSDANKAIGDTENRARSAAQNIGQGMTNAGKAMTVGITAPLTALGAVALRASTQLNEGLANIQSLGVAQERVDEFREAIQDMSVEVGKGTSDLTNGMYQVVSAFGDSGDSLKILQSNAQAAAAGLATTTDAINLTSAVTKGYGDTSAAAVNQVNDLAFTAVKLGQTTFPELASSMGRVVPLATQLGVAQEELFGVMATATGVTGNAAEVSTQLRGTLQALMVPTGDMTALFEQMGVESGAALIQQEGLQGAIEAVVQAAEASGEPLQSYMGSIEGQTLALTLAGEQADNFRIKTEAMYNSQGAATEAFEAQTQGANSTGFALQQLRQKLNVVAEDLGQGLIPALTAALDASMPLISGLSNMASAFADAPAPVQRVIVTIGALVATLGPALVIMGQIVGALGTLGAAFGVAGTATAGAGAAAGAAVPLLGGLKAALVAMTGPVGIVIGIVGALAAAFATDFMGIRTATMQGVQAVGQFLGNLGSSIGNLVQRSAAGFANVVNHVSSFVSNAGASLRNFAGQTVSLGADIINGVINGISSRVGAAFSAISNFGQNLLSRFRSSLRIASPSKAFEDSAAEIPAGVKQTLDKDKTAQAAASDMGERTIDGFAEGLDSGNVEKAIEEKVADIYSTLNDAMSKAQAEAALFGDAGDALSGQMSALKQAASALIDEGLSPQSAEVQQLSAQYRMLEAQMEAMESAQRIADIFTDLAESTQRAYVEQQLLGEETDLSKERVKNLETAIKALLDEGVSPMAPQVQALSAEYQALSAQIEAAEQAAAQQENFSKMLADISGMNVDLTRFERLEQQIIDMGNASELSAAHVDNLLDALAAQEEIAHLADAQDAFTAAQEKYLSLTDQAPSKIDAQVSAWESLIEQYPELAEGLQNLIDGLREYSQAQLELAQQETFESELAKINAIGREAPSQFDKMRAAVAEMGEDSEISAEQVSELYDAIDDAEAREELSELQETFTDFSDDITKLLPDGREKFEKLADSITAAGEAGQLTQEQVDALLSDLANTRAIVENRQAQETLNEAHEDFQAITTESVDAYADLDKETRNNISAAEAYIDQLEEQIAAQPRAAAGLQELIDRTHDYIDAQVEAANKQRRVEGIFEGIAEHTGTLSESLSKISPLAGEITGVLSQGASNILGVLKDVGTGGFKAADAFTAMGDAATSSSNLAISAVGSLAGAIGAFATGDIAGGITSVVTGAINLIGGLFRRSRKKAEEARKEWEALTDATQDYYEVVHDLQSELDNLNADQVGRLTTYFRSANFNAAGMENAKELLQDFIDIAGDSLQVINDLSEQSGLSFNADVERGEFDLFDFDSLREVSPFLAEQGDLIEEKLLELREQVRHGLQTEETERELAALTESYKQFSADITDSIDTLTDSWAGAFDEMAAQGITEGSAAWSEMGDSVEQDFNKFYAEKIRGIIIQAAITNAQLGLKMAEISRLAAEAVKTGDWSVVREAIRETGAEMRVAYENAMQMANEATAGLIQPSVDTQDSEDSLGKLRNMTDEQRDYEVAQNQAALEERVAVLQEMLAAEEAHSERYKEIKEDLADAEKDLNDYRQELADNRYQWDVEQGNISLEKQLANLEAKLANEEQYSDNWMAIQADIDGIRQQMHDKEQARLDDLEAEREAALAHEKELAENRYEVMRETGEISDKEHLTNLWKQLDGLEKYSNEWVAVWKEIRTEEAKVQDARLELQEKAAEKLEQQRQEAQRQLEEHEQFISGNLASAVSEGLETGDWQGASDSLSDNIDNFVLKAIDEGVMRIAMAQQNIPQMLAKVQPAIEQALKSGNVGQLRGIVANIRRQANEALGVAASASAQFRDAIFGDTMASPTVTPMLDMSAIPNPIADATSLVGQVETDANLTVSDAAFSTNITQDSALGELTEQLRRLGSLQKVDMSGATINVRDDAEYDEFLDRLSRDLRARGLGI